MLSFFSCTPILTYILISHVFSLNNIIYGKKVTYYYVCVCIFSPGFQHLSLSMHQWFVFNLTRFIAQCFRIQFVIQYNGVKTTYNRENNKVYAKKLIYKSIAKML